MPGPFYMNSGRELLFSCFVQSKDMISTPQPLNLRTYTSLRLEQGPNSVVEVAKILSCLPEIQYDRGQEGSLCSKKLILRFQLLPGIGVSEAPS